MVSLAVFVTVTTSRVVVVDVVSGTTKVACRESVSACIDAWFRWNEKDNKFLHTWSKVVVVKVVSGTTEVTVGSVVVVLVVVDDTIVATGSVVVVLADAVIDAGVAVAVAVLVTVAIER